jgi:hypothetical protein
MVTTRRKGTVKTEIRGDHLPPHFHIVSPNSDFMVDLMTFAVIRGRGDAEELREAIEWAKENHAALLEKWRDING